METETSVPHVYAAIADVTKQLSLHGITKNRKNAQQGYQFRGIDDIYNALAPMLAEARLCILPRVLERTVTERATKSGGTLFYVVADVEYDFVSAKDGSKHTVRVCGEAMDSGDKATNKAMSAAYKYACLQAFCIPTEGDNDADATTHEVAASAFKTKQAKTKTYNALKAAAADDDALKARETWDEMTTEEQQEIWRMFGDTESGVRSTLKRLLEQSKEAVSG